HRDPVEHGQRALARDPVEVAFREGGELHGHGALSFPGTRTDASGEASCRGRAGVAARCPISYAPADDASRSRSATRVKNSRLIAAPFCGTVFRTAPQTG